MYDAAQQNVKYHNAAVHTMLTMSPTSLSLNKFQQLGDFLREWRKRNEGKDGYLTLTEIGRRVGLESSRFSKLEKNYLYAFWDWNPKQQYDILKAYDLPDETIVDLSEKFKLEAAVYAKKSIPVPNSIVKGDLVSIRDLGTIQAGLKGLSYSNDEYEFTNVHKDDLNGYNPSDCFRVTVTGDSMVSDEVARRITPGSKAIFHILAPKMQPRENDIVAVWLRDEDIGVIKTYHKNQDFVILNSFNKHHRPIVIDDKQQGVIQGILVSVTQMFRS